MNILPCNFADSLRNLTFRSGLVALVEFIAQLKLSEMVNRTILDAHTLSNWLRRLEGNERCDQTLVAVNRQLLKAMLSGCREVTLEIDATSFELLKCEAKLTYKKTPV